MQLRSPTLKTFIMACLPRTPAFPAYYFQAPTTQVKKRFAPLFLTKGNNNMTTAAFRFTWNERTPQVKYGPCSQARCVTRTTQKWLHEFQTWKR